MRMTEYEMACICADSANAMCEFPQFQELAEKLHDVAQELAGSLLACIYDRTLDSQEEIEDMVGKHYKWHRQWTLDANNAMAMHKTGFSVKFRPASIPVTKVALLSWKFQDRKGTDWIVDYVGDDCTLDAYTQSQVKTGLRTEDNARNHIWRLMREGASMWLWHLNQLSPE